MSPCTQASSRAVYHIARIDKFGEMKSSHPRPSREPSLRRSASLPAAARQPDRHRRGIIGERRDLTRSQRQALQNPSRQADREGDRFRADAQDRLLVFGR